MVVAIVVVALIALGVGLFVRTAAREAGGLAPLATHLGRLVVGLVLFCLVVLPGLWIAVATKFLDDWLRT